MENDEIDVLAEREAHPELTNKELAKRLGLTEQRLKRKLQAARKQQRDHELFFQALHGGGPEESSSSSANNSTLTAHHDTIERELATLLNYVYVYGQEVEPNIKGKGTRGPQECMGRSGEL